MSRACAGAVDTGRDNIADVVVGTSGWTYNSCRGPLLSARDRTARLAGVVQQPVHNNRDQRLLLPHAIARGCPRMASAHALPLLPAPRLIVPAEASPVMTKPLAGKVGKLGWETERSCSGKRYFICAKLRTAAFIR